MIKRNPVKPTKETRSTRRWPTFMLILVCGLMLVTGFFFAGRQHFSSMDYGMKNSRLRKQVDELQAEKRRLLLAREVSMTPNEIKKAAKKVGFTDSAEPEAEIAKLTTPTAVPTTPNTVSTTIPAKEKAIPASLTTAQPKPIIVRTASVTATQKPLEPPYVKADSRAERVVKAPKRTTAAE